MYAKGCKAGSFFSKYVIWNTFKVTWNYGLTLKYYAGKTEMTAKQI